MPEIIPAVAKLLIDREGVLKSNEEDDKQYPPSMISSILKIVKNIFPIVLE